MCSEWKRHITVEDQDSDARPSLSDVAGDVVAELRYALRRARNVHRDDTAEAADRLRATALILKIGNTAAKVVESARKLQTDGLAAIRNMSFLERAELFIGWYTALPPSHRENLRAKQDAWEREQSKALPESTE